MRTFKEPGNGLFSPDRALLPMIENGLKRAMRAFLVLVLPLGASFCFASAADRADLCYGFLLRGDVVVQCKGVRLRLTAMRSVQSFAIARGHFAYAVDPGGKRLKRSTIVVNFASGAQVVFPRVMELRSTCGTILSAQNENYPRGAFDLLASRHLKRADFIYFDCDEKRRVFSGIQSAPPKSFAVDGWGSEVVRLARGEDGIHFATSPDGLLVVYPSRDLCIASADGATRCAPGESFVDDPAITNRGEILVATHTAKECFYRTRTDFSEKRAGGLSRENADACVALEFFAPGDLKPVELEPLGRAPQWIQEADFQDLMGWWKRRKRKILNTFSP